MLNNGEAINIQFAGRDMAQIQAAVAQTKTKLVQYPGVVDISDSFRGGKPEIKLDIKERVLNIASKRKSSLRVHSLEIVYSFTNIYGFNETSRLINHDKNSHSRRPFHFQSRIKENP